MPSVRDVGRALDEHFARGKVCLIAGAGVGVRAGMPTWSQFLEHLITVAERYEPETATLMRTRVASNNHAEAAHLYFRCERIPAGEKYRELAKPFEAFDAAKLNSLMSLPLNGVVTTNYDRSLHDSYQGLAVKPRLHGIDLKAPLHVELDDASLRSAQYWRHMFIARIHGRAEVPESMILETDHFTVLRQNASYLDFIAHVVKTFNCVWVGYSFLDPAIRHVLEDLEQLLPKPLPGAHLALLPAEPDPDLTRALARWNIEVQTYDGSNNHDALWTEIQALHRRLGAEPKLGAPEEMPSALSRFLAATYTRLSLGSELEPLREVVVQGILCQLLKDGGASGMSRTDLKGALHTYLALPTRQLELTLENSLRGLVAAHVCEIRGETVFLAGKQVDALGPALAELVERTAARLKVREGVDADGRTRTCIKQTIENLLLLRGWDLGAYLAGGDLGGDRFDGWSAVAQLVGNDVSSLPARDREAVTRTILDILRRPDEKDAEILCDLGRASFAIEVVLNSANTALTLASVLPDTLFLDANVVMPAILEGHPYSAPYRDSIQRVHTAEAALGSELSVFTAREFLNEVVSHRGGAEALVRDLGLEDPERLRRHIFLYGAQNTNVYVAAYASRVISEGPVPFEQFLNRIAPFRSEDELQKHLDGLGIKTVRLDPRGTAETEQVYRVKGMLEGLYGDAGVRPKADILVEHEARQLVRLDAERRAGRRPLFVTADRRLMRFCDSGELRSYSPLLVSDRSFIQLVDFLLGMATDKKSLARLMWSPANLGDEQTRIRGYATDLVLRKYNDVLAMASTEVIDGISATAAAKLKDEKISLNLGALAEAKRTTRFMDQFENDFFKNMEEAIRDHERDQK